MGAAQEDAPARIGLDRISEGRRFSLEIARSIDAVAPQWREFETHALSHPFQCVDWLANWQATIGEARGTEPFIVVARDEEARIFLIAPLAIERSLLGRRLVWLGQTECDYNAPLVRADALAWLSPRAVEALWQAIVKRAGRCDYAELAKQAPYLGAYDNPFARLSTSGHACAAHMTRLAGPWDAFHAAKRSRKSRRRLRDKLRSLQRQGAVDIRFAQGGADRRRILDWLIEHKHAQLSADGVSNVFAEPQFRAFVRALGESGLVHERLVLATLEVDGEPAAVCMGLRHANRFYYVTAAYDAARYGRFSPGRILLERVIEQAVRDGLAWFDFTIGDEGYKADWCDVTMEMSNGYVPFTARGRAAVALHAAFIRVKAEIKAHPQLFAVARRVRHALRNIFLGPRPDPVPKAAAAGAAAPAAAARNRANAS
jgi:CelD/BcsL family acetyltransferase involved in cellulose biosynthesis